MSSIPLPALNVRPPEDALSQYGKAMSIRGMMQDQEAKGQENQVRAQQLKDQQAMTAAMQQWDGKSYDSLIPMVVKNGASANAVIGLKQHAVDQKMKYSQMAKDDAETGKNQVETTMKKNDILSGALATVMQAPDDQLPQALIQTAQQLAQNGVLDPSHLQAAMQIAQSGNPAEIRTKLDLLRKSNMANSQILSEAKDKADLAIKNAEMPGKQAQSDEQVRANAATILAGAKDQADYNKKRMQMPWGVVKDFPDQFNPDAIREMGMTPAQVSQAKVPTEASLAVKSAQGDATAIKARGLMTADKIAARPVNVINTNQLGGDANKAGLDLAADNYRKTGQLPGGFSRSPETTKAIIQRAAELDKADGGQGIAFNKAVYNANKSSLATIQKNFDQVTAFENTAGKNLDLFLKTAQPMIDSGSPFINTPLRSLSQQGLGSAELSAVNVARNTALTEIAKVLNSSNASGVLSDSARREVSELIGQNATLKQIYSAANILKQDMANRHQSYQEQIQDIQGRLRNSGGQQGTPQSGGADPFAQFGGRIHQ